MSHSSSTPDGAAVDGLLALFAQGRMNEAGVLASAMTVSYPGYGFAWKALAITMQEQGQAEPALAAMLEAGRLLPDDAEVHNNVGTALIGLSRFAEAEVALLRALALAPDDAQAHHHLATALYQQGKLAAANASVQRALALEPDYVEAHNNLGMVLQAQGRVGEALAVYRRTLTLHPLYAEAHSNLLLCLSQTDGVDAATLAAEYMRYADRFESPWLPHWPERARGDDPERPLRVGFVSGDLHSHPNAAFLEPSLARLARSPALSLHAYSNYAGEDAMSVHLRRMFASWTPVATMSDDQLASRIESDAIDILIDLSGHTAHNRLPVFARKPAPLQASWIGYPGSTGLTAIDYYLTAPSTLPPGRFDLQFAERLLHLKAPTLFGPSPLAPAVNHLPAIDNGYLTFGSFSHPGILNRRTIAMWSQLLRALPSSRMLLAFVPQHDAIDDVAALFALNGVARRRLDFHQRADMASCLALHHQVDICLDTFPYSNSAAVLDALYMGVPTMTLAGDTPASRQGAGILQYAGLRQFVAGDEAQFAEMGRALASELASLADLRTSLRAHVATLAASEAADIEGALRYMWRRWCMGLPSRPTDRTGTARDPDSPRNRIF